MAKTQYQTLSEPIAFTIPGLIAPVYPASVKKNHQTVTGYFVEPLTFTVDPVIDTGSTTNFYPRRQTQYQEFTQPLIFPTFDLVPPVYPNTVNRRYSHTLGHYCDPIIVVIEPIVVPDFIRVNEDFPLRRKLAQELHYRVEPIYFETLPIIIDAVYPSAIKRRKYQHHEFLFRTTRVVVPSVADFQSLILITAISARLDVRREVDSGIAECLASDVSGTIVLFNKAFKDVDGITLGVNDNVEKKAIFDFVDIPTPTFFKILVYDVLGVRVNAQVRWMARGII